MPRRLGRHGAGVCGGWNGEGRGGRPLPLFAFYASTVGSTSFRNGPITRRQSQNDQSTLLNGLLLLHSPVQTFEVIPIRSTAILR